ncbi:MAG: methyltransferase domain-containing protein [Deltaproteobacteria bacterium]|nr:methyltransferase domain-containing protein [Deltaproteobacteria bacterium]
MMFKDISRLQKIFGVGPLGAVISLGLLTIAAWVDHVLGHSTILANPAPLRVAGGALAVIGLGLYGWSLWTLRNWWTKDELCTTGPFKWFRHPVYAAWITFISLSLALYLNSWIILFVVILLHPIWHHLVIREEKMMSDKFQNEYTEYAARTGRFIPKMLMKKNRVCPVEQAGSLDNKIRRWVQDPTKILRPYIEEGMTVLDMGCGPGFFSIDLAQLVGQSGRVIASDLQDGMLQKLRDKIQGTELEERITLHKCEENRIGLSKDVDFILAFYVAHEIPNQEKFFNEIKSILKPNGRVFIVEPPLHVSKTAFEETVKRAGDAGFTPVERPKVFLSKAVILKID